MPNYHVLGGSQNGNRYSVVYHIPVPDQNNGVGVSWRTAIVERQGGAPILSRLVGIGAEQAGLDAGLLYEVPGTLLTHPGETLLQKQAKLDALYQASVIEELSQLQNELYFWGYNRDIP